MLGNRVKAGEPPMNEVVDLLGYQRSVDFWEILGELSCCANNRLLLVPR